MKTLFTALRALIFMSGFVWLWAWVALSLRPLDRYLGDPMSLWTRTLGAVLMMLGAALCLSCIGLFVVRGRGTPAPFDPPRRFVAAGPYRYVRNPMYIGGLTVLAGFGFLERSKVIVLFSFAWLLIAHLFVVLYEEPVLKRQFGQTYEEYRRTVPRWLPRRRAPAPLMLTG